ncbi:MAG TPA: O-antigen ligase family protein, partial [Gaiellaceae bacterium]|nr:O-antigen ligase family protein [Gaiellaceae bacterium]
VLAALVARRSVSDATRARVDRAAGYAGIGALVVVVVVALVFARRIWHTFANPVSSQISSSTGHLGSLNSSNRWRWWQEAWHAFTRHPGGGTGAGTFQLTDKHLHQAPIVTTEPHNVPLQFLSETGIVGFLLFLAAAGAALVGAARARGAAAVALAIAVGVFFVHLLADVDWDYVATCGPLLFVAGALAVRGVAPPSPSRRPLVAAAAVLCAFGAVYSLAAPWLAQRQLATASTIPQVKRAHAYDPLSTDVLTEWAAFESAVDPNRALQLYRDAVSLEPQNDATWIALGDFFWDYHRWAEAYLAYSEAWHDDKFGPMGTPCGRLDQARYKVLKVWPASCPGGRPAATH